MDLAAHTEPYLKLDRNNELIFPAENTFVGQRSPDSHVCYH